MKTSRRRMGISTASGAASDALRARPQRAHTAEGQALPAGVRAEMEPRLGHDFGNVRVHTDATAAAAARGLDARAYAVSEDIGFAAGRYAPDSAAGRELIAHELAHVAQQARPGSTPDAEARADAAASRVTRGGSVSAAELGGAPTGVQTKPDEPGPMGPEEAPDVITGADAGAAEPAAPAATAPSATVIDGFTRDKPTLNKKHLDAIEQIAFSIWLHLSLYADAKATTAISGHTDTTGSEEHNAGLGAARAENAKAALEAALQKQQVDPKRLGPVATKSLGKTQLLVPTGDGVDEPANRRVEIDVTIEVKPPPAPKPAPPAKPLPGMPGGPKIWEIPGVIEGLDPPPTPPAPRVPTNKGEWLKDALERDPLLRKLPKKLRQRAIDALKDADEKLMDVIIDAAPFEGEYKEAAKAAAKALLQTLKGREFKPPPSPRNEPDWKEPPSFPKVPGTVFFIKIPKIRF